MAGNDNYTKLLLHLDSDFNDSSVGASETHTPVNSGATIDNTVYKWTGSGYFNGSVEVKYGDSEDWNFANGDFTIDFWVKRAVTGQRHLLAGQTDLSGHVDSTSVWIEITATDQLQIWISNGSSWYGGGAGNIADTNWHHIAMVRSGNNLYGFIDGILGNTFDITGQTVNNPTSNFAIGCVGDRSAYRLYGRIDEFRISKGIARWTSNFTPPTEPYSQDEETPQIVRTFSDEGLESYIDMTFYARVTGLTQSDFTAEFYLDNVSQTGIDYTIAETGNGWYKLSFRPISNGHWEVFVTRNTTGEKWYEDINELPQAFMLKRPDITQWNYQKISSMPNGVYRGYIEVSEVKGAQVFLPKGMSDYIVNITPLTDRAQVSAKKARDRFYVYGDRKTIVEYTVINLDIFKRLSTVINKTAEIDNMTIGGEGNWTGQSVIPILQENPDKPLKIEGK